MELDKAHADPDSEVAKAVEALNELRDVLNDVSLHLKDLKAQNDFDEHGNAWAQSAALIEGLFSSLASLQPTSTNKGAVTNTGGGG